MLLDPASMLSWFWSVFHFLPQELPRLTGAGVVDRCSLEDIGRFPQVLKFGVGCKLGHHLDYAAQELPSLARAGVVGRCHPGKPRTTCSGKKRVKERRNGTGPRTSPLGPNWSVN